MRPDQQKRAEELLKNITEQLATLHHEMVCRRKEKSILQKRARHEKMFNSKMEKISMILQNYCTLLHELLTVCYKNQSNLILSFNN